MCIHPAVGDGLFVDDHIILEEVVRKTSVVAVIVFDAYAVGVGVLLKRALGLYCLLTRGGLLEMYVSKVAEVIHEDGGHFVP